MKVQRNPKLLYKYADGAVYLFDDTHMTLFKYNPVASFIWKNTKKPVSVDDLVRMVCAEFDVDEKTAAKDISGFIRDEMSDDGLFVPVDK